jgi:hypothetical protein
MPPEPSGDDGRAVGLGMCSLAMISWHWRRGPTIVFLVQGAGCGWLWPCAEKCTSFPAKRGATRFWGSSLSSPAMVLTLQTSS